MASDRIRRRSFLSGAFQPPNSASPIDLAHHEIWRRFIDPSFGTLYDYAPPSGKPLLPTPGECRLDKPNGLAWWTPIENGAFFGGLYLVALCQRFKRTRDPLTRTRIKTLAGGLVRLGTVGAAPGFVARGLAADGRSHHVAGSDDQTYPWLYGLAFYLESGLPEPAEKPRLLKLVESVALALRANGWSMPCDRPGFGNRGTWMEPNFIHAARLLSTLRILHRITGGPSWDAELRRCLTEKLQDSPRDRLSLLSQGALYEGPGSRDRYPINPPFWTSASSQLGLRYLHDTERDPEIRRAFAQGLAANAAAAVPHIARFKSFDPADSSVFNHDWRFLNGFWKPQTRIEETVALGNLQSREWSRRSPRRVYEGNHMREPLFAAWVASLHPSHDFCDSIRPQVLAAIAHFPCRALNSSCFFAAELAFEQLSAV